MGFGLPWVLASLAYLFYWGAPLAARPPYPLPPPSLRAAVLCVVPSLGVAASAWGRGLALCRLATLILRSRQGRFARVPRAPAAMARFARRKAALRAALGCGLFAYSGRPFRHAHLRPASALRPQAWGLLLLGEKNLHIQKIVYICIVNVT